MDVALRDKEGGEENEQIRCAAFCFIFWFGWLWLDTVHTAAHKCLRASSLRDAIDFGVHFNARLKVGIRGMKDLRILHDDFKEFEASRLTIRQKVIIRCDQVGTMRRANEAHARY